MAKKHCKPLPYYVQGNSYPVDVAAKQLRETFGPLMAKRLPTVAFGGFRHAYIPDTIAKYKKDHSFFLRLDIEKFYPSLDHNTLIVQSQLAYKYLLGLDYVPKSFKKKFLPSLIQFIHDLQGEYGIPLGNSMSSVLAPLVFVPLLLRLKSFGIPFIVFSDDFLLFCKNEKEMEESFRYVRDELSSIGLKLNMGKLASGWFSSGSFHFCGWQIHGGYYTVAAAKIEDFKQRIDSICSRRNKSSTRVLIKKLNQQLLGFGHYYKYGNNGKVFGQLDAYVRAALRGWMNRTHEQYASNANLQKLGLKSRIAIRKGLKQSFPPAKKGKVSYTMLHKKEMGNKAIWGELYTLVALAEKLNERQGQILALQRQQTKYLKEMAA